MSRIINPDSAGRERNLLIKAVVLALRELAQQKQPTQESHDLAAFIALALLNIADTIDASVAAWEKRGYWVKADRFRMDWRWTGQLGEQIRQALLHEDWGQIAMLSAQVGEKLQKVTVSPAHRMGRPWEGAWKKLRDWEGGQRSR